MSDRPTDYSVLNAKAWEEYLHKTPCVKQSNYNFQLSIYNIYLGVLIVGYLVGIGCGAVMVSHQLRLHSMHFIALMKLLFNHASR